MALFQNILLPCPRWLKLRKQDRLSSYSRAENKRRQIGRTTAAAGSAGHAKIHSIGDFV
jgi:predicted alpha/beta hydrolase family esterase